MEVGGRGVGGALLYLFPHRNLFSPSWYFFLNIITLSARGFQGRKSFVSLHKCTYAQKHILLSTRLPHCNSPQPPNVGFLSVFFF